MARGFAEFEFDLPEALLERLVRAFAVVEPAQLTVDYVRREVPEAQGVYQLFLRDKLVYIGKTDADKGLRRRLERHATTVRHRQNLPDAEITFKAIRVFVFTAMDLESQMIGRYGAVDWQNSGFGSNDPGRNREDTRLKPGGFDELYPINIDHPIDFDFARAGLVANVLADLKRQLPYVFRYEPLAVGSRQPHPELAACQVTLPAGMLTLRRVMQVIVQALPPGWQATDMYSRVIVYRETREYAHGTVIIRS